MHSHAADLDASLVQLEIAVQANVLRSCMCSFTRVPQLQEKASEQVLRACLKLAAERIEWFNVDAQDANRVCKPPPKKKKSEERGWVGGCMSSSIACHIPQSHSPCTHLVQEVDVSDDPDD